MLLQVSDSVPSLILASDWCMGTPLGVSKRYLQRIPSNGNREVGEVWPKNQVKRGMGYISGIYLYDFGRWIGGIVSFPP